MSVKDIMKSTLTKILKMSREDQFRDTTLICKDGEQLHVNGFLLTLVFPAMRIVQNISDNSEEDLVISVPDVEKSELDSLLTSLSNQETSIPVSESISYLLLLKDFLDEDVTNIPLGRENLKEENHIKSEVVFKAEPEDYEESDNIEYLKEVKEDKHEKTDNNQDVDTNDHHEEDRNDLCSDQSNSDFEEENPTKLTKKERLQSTRQQTLACPKCDKVQNTLTNHKKHMMMHQRMENNEFRAKCNKCGKGFFRLDHCQTHTSKCKGKEENDDEEKTREEADEFNRRQGLKVKAEFDARRPRASHFTCEVCGELVSTSKAWYHKRKHEPDKFCDKCNKWINGPNFNRHTPCMKEKKQAEICNICGKLVVFLKQHMRKNHSESKPTKTCEICGKTMPTSAYYFHVKRHKTPEETCPECGKTFKHLSSHMYKVHKPNSQKRFQCTFCGKGFTDNFNLRKHENLHKKVLPHGCRYEGCDSRYTDQNNRNRHEKEKHGQLYQE